MEVTKKAPAATNRGFKGGHPHAFPIIIQSTNHINGCPKNAGRCPKKDPVSGRSRASRGQPPGDRDTLPRLDRLDFFLMLRHRSCVIALAVMLVGLPTAQAADTTLTLACQGTATLS